MGERCAGPPPFCKARKIHPFYYIHSGVTVRYKRRLGPRLYFPPPNPRAGFSARHPSKAAELPQPGNFGEYPFHALR